MNRLLLIIAATTAVIFTPHTSELATAQESRSTPTIQCRYTAPTCFTCGLAFRDATSKLNFTSGGSKLWTLTGQNVRRTVRRRTAFKACDMPAQQYAVKFSFRRGTQRLTLRRSYTFLNSPPVRATATPTGGSVPSDILNLDNFEYLGSAKLPQNAAGNSTGFSTGLLAVRKVAAKEGSEIRFFSDSHIYTSGALYEFSVPSFGTGAALPAATVVKDWGNVYGNTRVDAEGKPITYPITALFWDKALGGLWWAGNPGYNTLNRESPSAGVVLINDNGTFTPTPAQRFYTSGRSNTHWVRGCVIEIPPRFASLFGNKNRGIGCGGYYSIIGGGSWGPALTVFDSEKIGERKTVLGYPVDGNIRAPRPGDYFMAESAGSGTGWMGVNPENGEGKWTGSDEVGGESSAGGAVFLDLPEGMGFLVWASHGQGRIGYDAGAITQASRINRLYVYDPRDLVAGYAGQRDISPLPSAIVDWPIPAGFLMGRIAGVVVDPDDSNILYVVHVGAYKDGVEFYPVIHKYRIKPR